MNPRPLLESALEAVAQWRGGRVLLLGDFMIDRALHGAAERLSPDAPVPVLAAKALEDASITPGGAGNVARCLRALGMEVTCVGLTGADSSGELLRGALRDCGCDVTGMVADHDRPTTEKISLVGLAQHRHPQKMFRIDLESRSAPGAGVLEQLRTACERALQGVDVVCIEDYGKGACGTSIVQWLIKTCRSRGIEVLVDPAPIADYSPYRGATCITPNRSEAERATRSATPIEPPPGHAAALARTLRTAHELDVVLVTLDRHGALLDTGGSPQTIPTQARLVYDVTGAGDMVLAALAAARLNGLGWPEATAFANTAAGLEVEVFGAQPIPLTSVRRELLRLTQGASAKVRPLAELMPELDALRSTRRIVLTNGCFDVIHAGHVAYLREARALGDTLVVGINSDSSVRQLKGDSRPTFPQADRAEVLAEMASVDFVVIFNEPTAHELIRAVRPAIYAKGGDYIGREVRESDLLEELGIECRLLAHVAGRSSTEVLARMRGE